MKITLVVDTKLRRPACVLLQAVAGCPYGIVTELFDSACWLVQPTPDMVRVTGTREQWEQFAEIANKESKPKECK